MEKLFYPRTVAVIGATGNPQKLGRTLMENLCSGFRGTVYPISIREEEILGIRCHKSILDIDDAVDLALIIVPSDNVPRVMEECATKGVAYAVILSGGFSEIGHEGEILEKKVAEIARRAGIRVVGPNCVGISNTDAPMNASFTLTPGKGRISCVFQSGALGSSVIYIAINESIGINKFVSIGNMCDLEFSDFVSYLKDDPSTSAIALYIEGLKKGRAFFEAMRSLSREKPIVVFKAGNTLEGMKAVSSHTGSLAGDEKVHRAAFRQAGLLQVESLVELLDAARAFLAPSLKGRRIAVMTNAGGPAIIAVDALHAQGLALAELSEKTRETLRTFLPPFASLNNPIDMIASARAEQYEKCVRALEEDENVDGILAIIVIATFAGMNPTEQARGLVSGYRGIKPLLACCMAGGIAREATEVIEKAGIVTYPYPERAVFALGTQMKFSTMRGRVLQSVPSYEFDTDSIQRVLLDARDEERHQLLEFESKKVLEAAGFSVPPFALSSNYSECARVAESLGYPVALKVSSKDIVHKTDVGGVRLNIRNESELRSAYEDMMRSLGSADVLVSKMVEGGTEMIVGATDDPQFGPVVMCGFGGIYVEAIGDTSFRIAPVTREEAFDMIAELRSSKILYGVRGKKRGDVEALAETVARLSALACRQRDIVEIDINPATVLERGKGVQVVDARITLRH